MSEYHLQCIESLITQAQEFLYTVQRNQAPNMDTFDHVQKTQFESLKALGPISHTTPYLNQIRVRMEYLESLNREMIEVIKKLLADSRNQLKARTTQRRGISGYQRSLFGRNRGKGVWRGRG
jgi:hypothetical protein